MTEFLLSGKGVHSGSGLRWPQVNAVNQLWFTPYLMALPALCVGTLETEGGQRRGTRADGKKRREEKTDEDKS